MYYATGNNGGGTYILAFKRSKDRDDFVSWDDSHDNRNTITRQQARKYKQACLIDNSETLDPWIDLK